MDNHAPVEDDPAQLESAQTFWTSFMQSSKYSIIFVVIVLIALLVMFVPFG